jgi:chlorite dismutase
MQSTGLPAPQSPLLVHFDGCTSGKWRVTAHETLIGDDLVRAPNIAIRTAATVTPLLWSLSGVVSNLRYTTSNERKGLAANHADLGRNKATRAALIPIRKRPEWWALAQDERRAIYERSAHTPIGLEYLPAVARRLHHSRDLGEPFDFLTWFEFAAKDEGAFDELLLRLRRTEEWDYVDREIEIRLSHNPNR